MTWKRLAFLLVIAVAVVALSPVAGGRAQSRPVYGINPEDMDFRVDPRADFYRYANGGWLDRTTIPADSGEYGVFDEVIDRTTEQLLGLLERLAGSGGPAAGSDEAKAVQLYRQGTDLAARNRQGIAPIQSSLTAIGAIRDLEGLHRYLQTSTFEAVVGPFGTFVIPDLRDSTVNAVYLSGPFLGLPNRDYYLDDDEASELVREAYVATAAKLLILAGHDAARAEADARAVYELERAFAAETLTREEGQNLSLIYNPATLAELARVYPLLDWPAFMRALGVEGTPPLIVTETKYLAALDGIIRATPLETLKTYLVLELLWSTGSYLSEPIERTIFDFSGTVLAGVEEQSPLEERVLNTVNGALGDALGKLYVAEYFPPPAKAQIEELVAQLITAFGQRLEATAWMSAETKVEARRKLATLGVKVGYPDRWRSYAQVQLGDSYARSTGNAFAAELRRQYGQVGKPVDKSAWDLPPQTVNAFYDSLNNEIVFPAGILQAPFFDYRADAAANFGAIGFVIGHEITHGFDLRGSQFDADGNLRDWWNAADIERFTALNRRVAGQYGAIQVLPGMRVNGQITVTENVADMGGVQVAYDALRNHLATTKATPLPAGATGFAALTPEQKFFIAAASAWRAKTRDEYLATQVRVDTHSPAKVRATQPIRNMDAFYAAFGIGPGDPEWLSPDERIVIW